MKYLGSIPQHIWDNEEPYMTSSYIDLIKMRHAPITGRHGDVLQLNVHVIFGCNLGAISKGIEPIGQGRAGSRSAFNELSTEDLPGGEFEGANVALFSSIEISKHSARTHSREGKKGHRSINRSGAHGELKV